jgi:hypothetical protein
MKTFEQQLCYTVKSTLVEESLPGAMNSTAAIQAADR